MGDYADMEIDAGIGSWRGGDGARYWGRSRDLPPQYCHVPKRCNRCGTAPLYWEQHEGKWRLHAYESGQYVLHTCVTRAANTGSGSGEVG